MSAGRRAVSAGRRAVSRGGEGPLLAVHDLAIAYETESGPVGALDGLSFDLRRGEVVALVGESGSGKTSTALALLGLLPPAGRVLEGTALFGGEDLLQLPPRRLRTLRGDRVAMVFQDPLGALNPVQRIGTQIAEVIRAHRRVRRREARQRTLDLLAAVGIPEPALRARQYPHELSGGMRQRALIAAAIALEPELLIADEPTSALDVTVQAQILELLDDIRGRLGMGVLLITHDLGVVAETADRMVVLHDGRAVDSGTVREVFRRPRAPATRRLLASVLRIDRPRRPNAGPSRPAHSRSGGRAARPSEAPPRASVPRKARR